MENYNIGTIMRGKREALGYTRKKVCERCKSVTEKTLARLEGGKARVRRESIRELLELYHQRSHTIYPVLDLENPAAGHLYRELMILIFQRNYREAQRKLEIFERYVNKQSEESIQYLEVIKRELLYFMGKKEVEGKETVQFLDKLIAGMMPEETDLEKWPLNWQELNTYMAFFNVLAAEGQYGKIIPIVKKILANIERHYQNSEMFADFHGCFSRRLIRCLLELGQNDEIVNIAKKSLEICASVGHVSNTYRLQGELLNYFWINDFFQSDEIKEQCLEEARDAYELSAICQDKKLMRYFRMYLRKACGYVET